MRLTIFGSGYVGLVTGACFAEVGNTVLCFDIDKDKIELLKEGQIPIFEPGLSEMILSNQDSRRIAFTNNLIDSINHSETIFIAVGTPQDEDGSADITSVLKVAESIAENMTSKKNIIIKSTVPVGTSEKVQELIGSVLEKRKQKIDFCVASNPEFLKEGNAISDFMKPDRVIIGSTNKKIINLLKKLYEPFQRNHDRVIVMDTRSSEFSKYASNAMLATKVSFMNEMANLAEHLEADIESIRNGIGSDSRIGYSFIYPGPGYGGSCFPKDIKALIRSSKEKSYSPKILEAVDEVNNIQKNLVFKKMNYHFKNDLANKVFSIWGLSFKPETDDMRESPSINLIDSLMESGAKLRVYDPKAMKECLRIYGEKDDLFYAKNQYEALHKADALIVMTEWKEFRSLDLNQLTNLMKDKVIFDGRNIYDPHELEESGFTYYGIGRGKKIY